MVAILFLATISFSHPKKNINKGRTNQKNKKVFGILHNLYYTGPRPIGMMSVKVPLLSCSAAIDAAAATSCVCNLLSVVTVLAASCSEH